MMAQTRKLNKTINKPNPNTIKPTITDPDIRNDGKEIDSAQETKATYLLLRFC